MENAPPPLSLAARLTDVTPVGPGGLLPSALHETRGFEDFSADLGVWVVFYRLVK